MKWIGAALVVVMGLAVMPALAGQRPGGRRGTEGAKPQAPEPRGMLDSTVWWIELVAKGEQPMPDQLAFARGLFDSRGCHEFGFGGGKYTAAKAGEAVKFTAATKSEKQGAMAWAGEVKGEKISGTMKWTPAKGAAKDYTFSGIKHKPAGALDGSKWKAELTAKGEKPMADTLAFAEGRVESTACRQYGFRPGAYLASKKGEEITFRAYTTSPKEGVMEWTGTAKAGKLTGTVKWFPKTGAMKTYTVSGTKQ